MPKDFEFEVVTPERVVISERVESLIVPGVQGYMGVLADHAPMVVSLKPGVVKYKEGTTFSSMAVSGGFLEVSGNKAVIISDAAELSCEIDVERARAAKRRAEDRIRSRGEGIDLGRAHAALQRALARLKAAGSE